MTRIMTLVNHSDRAAVQTVDIFKEGSPQEGEQIWVEVLTLQGARKIVWEGKLTGLYDNTVRDTIGTRTAERHMARLIAQHYLHHDQLPAYTDVTRTRMEAR